MIRKKDLLIAIDEMTKHLWYQSERINNLEEKVFGNKKKADKVAEARREKIKKAVKEVTKEAPKRGRGRPRKNA